MTKMRTLLLVLISVLGLAAKAMVASSPVKVSTDEETQWYFIMSYAYNSSCYKTVIYNTRAKQGGMLRWAEKSLDENALWKFEDAGNNCYYIVNKATGLRMAATTVADGEGQAYATDEQSDLCAFRLARQTGAPSYTIATVGGNPIYAASNSGLVVTTTEKKSGTPASWYFKKATDDEVAQAAENARSDREDYVTVWEENFDHDGLPDEKDWNYESGFVRNYENQWYQKGNATVEDGNLVIEGRVEHKENPTYVAGSSNWGKSREFIEYTSSSLTTYGKHAFTYGRLEVRAKIPVCTGSWPAIWLLGNEDGQDYHWPHSGEIDVLEYYNGYTWANFCWGANGTWNAQWNSRNTPMSHWYAEDADWVNAYHTWRMDWSEEAIRLYLDDELINVANLDNTINNFSSVSGTNPFRGKPLYVLLNLAMGGSNGGTIDDALLPLHYYIDYVRISQKPGQTYEEYGESKQTAIRTTAAQGSCSRAIHRNADGRWAVNASGLKRGAKARIFDAGGKCVATQSVSGQTAPLRSLDRQPAGIYTVQLSDGAQCTTAKIIK